MGTGKLFLTHYSVLGTKIDPCALISVFGVAPQGLQLPVGGRRIIAFGTLLLRHVILLKSGFTIVGALLKRALLQNKKSHPLLHALPLNNTAYSCWVSATVAFSSFTWVNMPLSQVKKINKYTSATAASAALPVCRLE